jgi:phosphatidate cytidylyltransferase
MVPLSQGRGSVTDTPPKKSDLGVRTLSAIVMVAVAGTALWLGGWVWTAFVALVALGVLWEWTNLVLLFEQRIARRVIWLMGGCAYVGLGATVLAVLRFDLIGLIFALLILCSVVCVDVGAYFAGRTFGGPKIAPSLSPSKTWAGLAGGAVVATAFLWLAPAQPLKGQVLAFLIGPLLAVIAQTGDFFESWMKRKAGVKDSGALIPGHGGLFDRVDGLLAVSFAIGIVGVYITVSALVTGAELIPAPA